MSDNSNGPVTVICGITDDLARVIFTIVKGGEAQGWAVFTPEQCDHFIVQLEKYNGLIKISKSSLKPGV